jgi:hypothetical protein
VIDCQGKNQGGKKFRFHILSRKDVSKLLVR